MIFMMCTKIRDGGLLRAAGLIRCLAVNSVASPKVQGNPCKYSYVCNRCLSGIHCNMNTHLYADRSLLPLRNKGNTNLCVNFSKSEISSQVRAKKFLLHTEQFFKTLSRVPYCQTRGLKTSSGKVAQNVEDFLNPLDRLQQFVAVPLLKDKEYIFKPSIEEVAKGQQLYIPHLDHKIEFLQSALLEEQLPVYDLPEVAFIGRSNVGKSTLINMLLSHTDVVVKCSKHAGHTRLLNFFQVGKNFTLVDMPGYGFNMPEYYASTVEKFLSTRKKLSRTFILVDGTVGVTENDVIGLNMLEEFHIPYVMTFLLLDGAGGSNSVDDKRFEMIKALNIDFCIVMTKIDKAKPATLIKNFMSVLKYRNQTHYCFSQPFLVSSTKGEGVPLLQAFIAYVTGNLAVKGL